jgi:hypothetical protein
MNCTDSEMYAMGQQQMFVVKCKEFLHSTAKAEEF